HKELGLVSKTPLNRPIGAYMGACALATAWGIGFAHVRPLAGLFYLLKYLEYFFVYYIAVNNIRARPQAQRLVIIALVTAAIVSAKRALLVPVVVLGLLLIPYFAPKVVRERVAYTFKTQYGQPTIRLGGAAFDPSTSERLLSFKEALEAWTTRPILGFGITGF